MPKIRAIAISAALLVASGATAFEQTVGLFLNDPSASNGYTLFGPLGGSMTYLIDIDGQLVHSWQGFYPSGHSSYILDNGHLLRAADPGDNDVIVHAGDAGLIQEFDWDGSIVWWYRYSDDTVRAHHDIAPLPNGNVLIVAWELKTAADAIAAGRDPSLIPDGVMLVEHIVEVEPVGLTEGNIVWEWYAWDHLVQDFDPTKANFGDVSAHPELLDLNFLGGGEVTDWAHVNAIDYHAELDQIVLCSRNFSEFWIIDHGTTTEEAAGHTGGLRGRGGDLLYRWGNPMAYGAGTSVDRQLFEQHDAHWIDSGKPGADNILVFNNGNGRASPAFSSVDEIVPPLQEDGTYALAPGEAYGPAAPVWTFVATPPTNFYAAFISGCDRQPNGNTLACIGPVGTFFEVAPDGTIVWIYISPAADSGPLASNQPIPSGPGPFTLNWAFRSDRYAPDHPGLAGRDLTPRGPIELPAVCEGDLSGDGSVGFADLSSLLAAWGLCDGDCPADLDGGGSVGFADLTILLERWGSCVYPGT